MRLAYYVHLLTVAMAPLGEPRCTVEIFFTWTGIPCIPWFFEESDNMVEPQWIAICLTRYGRSSARSWVCPRALARFLMV